MARAQPGILAVWQDWAPGAEALVADWYNREHHAERVAVPGNQGLDGLSPRFPTPPSSCASTTK